MAGGCTRLFAKVIQRLGAQAFYELKVLMMKIHLMRILSIGALVLYMSLSAAAGTIQTFPVPPAESGPGLGLVAVPAVLTLSPNNDNVPGNPNPNLQDNNIVVPVKRFDNNDYIDIVFTVDASGGVTEYAVSEFVDNNTGINWSSYTMQLGTGVGAGFVMSTAGDGLDFDDPDLDTFPSSLALPTVTTGEDQLVFSGGIQGTGAQPYEFRIDLPDSLTLGPGQAVPLLQFTLRQFPTPIPEPTSIALIGMAVVGILGARRRS
jgi:hypothetical protein